jgi:hypothetical protein
MTVYDPKTPQIWRVPFRDRVEASLVVRAPRGGYVVPAEHAETVGTKLTLHGIAFESMRHVVHLGKAGSLEGLPRFEGAIAAAADQHNRTRRVVCAGQLSHLADEMRIDFPIGTVVPDVTRPVMPDEYPSRCSRSAAHRRAPAGNHAPAAAQGLSWGRHYMP